MIFAGAIVLSFPASALEFMRGQTANRLKGITGIVFPLLPTNLDPHNFALCVMLWLLLSVIDCTSPLMGAAVLPEIAGLSGCAKNLLSVCCIAWLLYISCNASQSLQSTPVHRVLLG